MIFAHFSRVAPSVDASFHNAAKNLLVLSQSISNLTRDTRKKLLLEIWKETTSTCEIVRVSPSSGLPESDTRDPTTLLTRQKSSNPNMLKFLISPQLILDGQFWQRKFSSPTCNPKKFTFSRISTSGRGRLEKCVFTYFQAEDNISHTLCRSTALTVCDSIIIATNSHSSTSSNKLSGIFQQQAVKNRG